MAVRRKLHRAFGGRGTRRRRVFGGLFGQKTDKEVERVEGTEGTEGIEMEDVEVLRPVRNRRWQF
jgi:hypothetical protein